MSKGILRMVEFLEEGNVNFFIFLLFFKDLFILFNINLVEVNYSLEVELKYLINLVRMVF